MWGYAQKRVNKKMPELINEIPTNEELFIYLMEHIGKNIFGFSFINQFPDEKDKRYKEFYRDFTVPFHKLGFSKYFKIVAEHIFDGLKMLNEFPRTDSFWGNTNNRPTIYKLPSFCEQLLSKDKCNERALWTRLSLNIYWGSPNFGAERWKILMELERTDISFPIFAAFYSYYYSGYPTCGLIELIKDTDSKDEAIRIFDLFDITEIKLIIDWSKEMKKGFNQ
jgi:hypothetical protein